MTTTETPVELTTAPADAPVKDVALTEAAAVKVRALLDQEGRDDLRLRVAVQPGGCSGMQYQLFFDERSLDGDVELDLGGAPVRRECEVGRQPQKELPQAQPPPALGLSIVKPCCSIVSVKSIVAPPR